MHPERLRTSTLN